VINAGESSDPSLDDERWQTVRTSGSGNELSSTYSVRPNRRIQSWGEPAQTAHDKGEPRHTGMQGQLSALEFHPRLWRTLESGIAAYAAGGRARKQTTAISVNSVHSPGKLPGLDWQADLS
jgi:hypothetical protein